MNDFAWHKIKQFGFVLIDSKELEGDTLFLVPFPLSCLIEAFRLASKYTPKSRSMRMLFSSWEKMYGTNTLSPYSWSVLDVPGLSIWTTASPSISIAWATGALLFSSRFDSRQRSRSAWTPNRIFLQLTCKAGGAAWFSWEKISPSLVWHEMYILKKRPRTVTIRCCKLCLLF